MDEWKCFDGNPFYVNITAMLETDRSIETAELAVDLVRYAWMPTKTVFAWDEKQILNLLNAARPRTRYTQKLLRRNEEAVQDFFTVLSDGRWAPSARFFSLVN